MPAPTMTQPNDDAVLGALRDVVGDRLVTVLDLGGGTGVYAVPIARDGHRVEVLDQSNDALATLARRAHDAGVGDRVSGRVADLDDLAGSIPVSAVDLVLCHRVLEFVDDPAATLAAAAGALTADGVISIVAANRPGAVLGRVIAGRYDEAAETLDGARSAQSGHRFDAAELTRLLDSVGLAVRAVRGVGLIGALNPSGASTPQARALDERLSTDPILAQTAPLLHVIAGRAGHGS
ncbi:class I SAM-dependent methyltransferase [Cumulibacter manganitolerans]|uniref:class I SAM-dependent methyltransferase n=1 Tax=Cumulibacter manganitolerans TaxID=1884992 RepID=UPI0012949132|nr:methyltransferase domain-containing protein [Cumulibacter manganitolerans]